MLRVSPVRAEWHKARRVALNLSHVLVRRETRFLFFMKRRASKVTRVESQVVARIKMFQDHGVRGDRCSWKASGYKEIHINVNSHSCREVGKLTSEMQFIRILAVEIQHKNIETVLATIHVETTKMRKKRRPTSALRFLATLLPGLQTHANVLRLSELPHAPHSESFACTPHKLAAS